MSNARKLADNLPAEGSLSGRNILINSAMQVAQRGTSQTGVNKYGVDRFRTQSSNSSIVSAQVSDAPDGFNHSLKLTNGGTDTGTGAYREVKYAVEGYDLAHWQKDTQSLTMSFWVKSSLAGTYQVAFRTDSGTDYWYSFAYTVSANTWTFVTHVIPPSPNSTLSSDNLSGLSIFFVQYYPDNWITGAATTNWETSSATSMATFPQHWANTANATWQLTGCQLELGDKGTDFEHEPYSVTLAKCQRYFFLETTTATDSSGRLGVGSGASTVVFDHTLPVQMRAKPSVSLTNANIRIGDMVAQGFTTSSGTVTINTYSGSQSVTYSLGGFSGLTSYRSYLHEPSAASPGMVQFDAEL